MKQALAVAIIVAALSYLAGHIVVSFVNPESSIHQSIKTWRF